MLVTPPALRYSPTFAKQCKIGDVRKERSSRPEKRRRKAPPRIQTRVGRLIKFGVNEWGKPLVRCPQCGGTATTGRTGEVWCRECGYTSAALAGCG